MDRVRVGEVLALQRREVALEFTTSYRLIGIYSFGKGLFHRAPVLGAELGDYRFFAIEPGDLVLSNIQAWEGAIGYATEADRGTIGTHRFLSYVPVGGRIDTNWARWYFLSEPGMTLIRRAAPGSTMRNRTLAIERFEALEIPLPPLDEQHRVATRLDRMASASGELATHRFKAAALTSALPLATAIDAERRTVTRPTRLGDVLELVRESIDIDPTAPYVTMGIRSFGRGIFHYPERPGAEIGKLRFQSVRAGLLAISNIKAWEGAVAATSPADANVVASNRFLLLRPTAGEEAVDYFWARLLSPEGIQALGHASPGSADRNRTLSVERFKEIVIDLPSPDDQVEVGRAVRAATASASAVMKLGDASQSRISALLPATLNEVFTGLT